MKKQCSIFLLCLSLVVFVLPIPFIEITGGHEAREGIRLRAMLNSDEWIFTDVLRKPPLYYWLSGLVTQVRGGVVDALSLRLPSGLLALFTIVLITGSGRQVASGKGALWAGYFLLTAPLYVQQSHSGRTDMTLCFFVTVSLLLFLPLATQDWRLSRQPRWRAYLFAGLLACAFLSKGPVGIILVALPIVSFLAWCGDWRGFQTWARPGPLFLFGLLAGGWGVVAWWDAGEEFWRTQVLEENVARFAGGIDHMSTFYYLGPLFGGFALWSIFLPFALWRATRERAREPGPFFLTLWWISIVLFFQLAAYKRARYLLPTLPPAALLVGWWISSHLQTAVTQSHNTPWWTLLCVGLTVALSLTVVTGALLLYGAQGEGPLSCRLLESVLGPEVARHTEVYCAWLATHVWLRVLWLGALTLCLGFFLWLLWSQRHERALVALLGALVLIYGGLYPSWLIVTSKAASPQVYTQLLLEKLGDEPAIAFINPYDEKGVPVLFALQEHLPLQDVQWPWGAPQPRLPSGYYLVSDSRRNELVSNATGVWTEVLHDTGTTKWSMTLFFYATP